MNSTTAGVKSARKLELQRSCEYRAAEGKASREEPAPMPNSAATCKRRGYCMRASSAVVGGGKCTTVSA